MADMMLIPKADLVAGYDAIRAKGVPGLIKSGELAGKIASIKGGFPNGTEWEISNVSEGSISVFADGRAVAKTETGMVYSEDGRDWKPCQGNVPQGAELGIQKHGGAWVCAGTTGIFASSDGITWSEALPGYVAYCEYGPGAWLAGVWDAAFENAITYESADGMSWSALSGNNQNTSHAAYGNGKWLATSVGVVYELKSGKWEKIAQVGNDINYIRSIQFVSGVKSWVIISEYSAYTSKDGVNWATVTGPRPTGKITESAGMLISGAGGGKFPLRSDDGTTWEEGTQIGGGVIQGGRSWTINHYAGLWIGQASDKLLISSTDGEKWKKEAQTPYSLATAITTVNGTRVASTTSGLYYSVTWEPS